MVGLDTGYFVGIIQGEKNIIDHWKTLRENEIMPYVSVLTLGEILYLTIRVGKPDQGRKMIEGIEKTSVIIDVDKKIVERAASLKGGSGIPYVDSIVIASFLENGCKELHTKDRNHFQRIKRKGLNIVIW
ncbi:MAG: tRNA(fMet)-specific endonuclease VapC [Syntrophorhabdaceae bacterium PtaU1.Bin034]|nr:MAG: tRNA(fMet)-specific endonuclease VapC [Syntrophorhabdaceae bacterium PtaU1.Bin034]